MANDGLHYKSKRTYIAKRTITVEKTIITVEKTIHIIKTGSEK